MPPLTKSRIDRARPQATEQFLWDATLPGFGVRILPSGRKSYIVQYRLHGRQRRQSLGTSDVLTVQQAREQARHWLADARLGRDPRQAPGMTIAMLAHRYLDLHAYPHKRPASAQRDAWMLRKDIVPHLGTLPVPALTRRHVVAFHHLYRSKPVLGNRLLALLSKMMQCAELWGLRQASSNPVRGVPKYPEVKRQRYLTLAELDRIGAVLRQAEYERVESPYALAAVRLLLLTGARVSEVLSLRWEYVDVPTGTVRLPQSKTGPKTLYLAAPALALVEALPRLPNHPYVLPGRLPGRPLSQLIRPWHRLRARAGLTDVRLHDLRHTFAAIGAGLGISLPLLGSLLGHRVAATTQRYAHIAPDPARQAAELVGTTLHRALG